MNAQPDEQPEVTTTSAMLSALREPNNRTVWWDFDARYRRVIEAFACKLGLLPEDATDVAQQALVEFARDYPAGRYDRDKGRLSAWIMGIARHRALDVLRARGRRRGQRGSSGLVDLREPELTRIWDEERDQMIFDRALDELREHSRTDRRTLKVFERVAIHGDPAARVAESFDINIDEVYRVKNRIARRLREIVMRLTLEYE